MSDEETTQSLVDKVIGDGAAGLTVAVQLHGFTDTTQLERLSTAGASVLSVAPYRWQLPEDSSQVLRLVDAVCTGSVEAVTFTSAPAVEALFAVADQADKLDAMLDAFGTGVVAAAVGPVTAAPLRAAGLEPLVPDRFRMGALIRVVCEHLEARGIVHLATAHGPLEIRGRMVEVAGRRSTLAPNSLTLFRALAAAGGTVLSRSQLAALLPDGPDDHAVDVAISRLRQSLPDPAIVATVIKRGYRIDA